MDSLAADAGDVMDTRLSTNQNDSTTVSFPRLLTPKDVAQTLSLNTRTVNRWCQLGIIPASKFGDYWRIEPKNFERFLREHRAKQ